MHLNTTWSMIITAVPAALIAFSGVAKLSGMKKVVEGLTNAGMVQYIHVLGVAEILFAVLFIIPLTNTVGFILLSCYFAGALATDLSHRGKIAPPVLILVSLFVTQYIVNPEIFFG